MGLKDGLQIFYKVGKVATSYADNTARYIKTCWKRSIFEAKPKDNTLSGITEAQLEKLSQSLFRQANEPKSTFLANLDKFKTLDIDIPKDVQLALNTLERKATIFADRMDKAVSRGIQPVYKDYYEEFRRINSEQFNIIENYYNNLLIQRYNSDINPKFLEFMNKILYRPIKIDGHHDSMYCGKITRTDKNIFGSDSIFYHGTKHQNSIARNGFRTKSRFSQSFCSRELGDAVYLTPDREVAAFYAGLRGGILKVSVNELCSASVNNNQLSSMADNIFQELGSEVNIEQVMKELFKRNGYNAAYSRKGLAAGLFAESIDPLIGKAQSQLAVYNPEDIAILPKTLVERIGNTKLQFKAITRTVKSSYNEIAEPFNKKRKVIADRVKKKFTLYPKEIRKQMFSKSDLRELLQAQKMLDNEEITFREFAKIRARLIEGKIIKGSDYAAIHPNSHFSQKELNQYFKDGCVINIS